MASRCSRSRPTPNSGARRRCPETSARCPERSAFPPDTPWTTCGTTPVAIVAVMADELGADTGACPCAEAVALGRDGNRSVDRGAGLPAIPGCAARCRALMPSPARRLPESSPSDVADARRLARGLQCDVAGCQTACHRLAVRRGRLPDRLPRACRPVAAHLQGWPSPDPDADPGGQPDDEKFTKVAGLGPVVASLLASAPEQAAHQHPRVEEVAQS